MVSRNNCENRKRCAVACCGRVDGAKHNECKCTNYADLRLRQVPSAADDADAAVADAVAVVAVVAIVAAAASAGNFQQAAIIVTW